jgi:Fic family protein
VPLFKSAKLDKLEHDVILQIKQMYKSQEFSLSNPSGWSGFLRRTAFARAIRGSNSIEGYIVTQEDALAAADGEEPLSAEGETWAAVMGYRNAMSYVLQLSKDRDFVFNVGYLRSLHFMMLQHDLSKHPGNWRPGPIYVRNEHKYETVYEGPPAEMVPRLIDELCAYLQGRQDEDHLLVKGAMAHLNLAMIHPFSDGNGRMARCLQTLVLAKRGIVDPTYSSIEEYLGRNTEDYYSVLALVGQGSWHPGKDTRPWIRFNLTAHYRQAGTLLRRTRMIAKLWDDLEREIKTRKLPDRVITALSDAAMGYQVRSAHYRISNDISAVLASRDLKNMVDAGLLESSGEKRGRTYSGSESLRKIWFDIKAGEPKKITDPFE